MDSNHHESTPTSTASLDSAQSEACDKLNAMPRRRSVVFDPALKVTSFNPHGTASENEVQQNPEEILPKSVPLRSALAKETSVISIRGADSDKFQQNPTETLPKAIAFRPGLGKETTFISELNLEEPLPRSKFSAVFERAKSFVSYGAGSDLENQLNLKESCKEVDKINRNVGMTQQFAKGWSGRYWLSYAFWPLVAIIIQVFFGLSPWWYPSHEKPICEKGGVDMVTMINALAVIAAKSNNDSVLTDTISSLEPGPKIWICSLVEALEDGTSSLTFLSAFIVGGFVISSVNNWQARRAAYCLLCGATRNLLISINSIVQNQKDRLLMTRWTVIAFELSMLQARELIGSESGRKYLDELNLLGPDDWATMIKDDRQGSVCFWIQAKAARLVKSENSSNRLDHFDFQTLCGAVSSFRAKGFDMKNCIAKDQPPPYVFVCGSLINFNLAFHAITSGFKWAIWIHNEGGSLWMEPKMYVSLFILFAYSTMYAMLFDICAILYNPFGGRDIDINHRAISANVRQFAKGLGKGEFPEESMKEEDYENENSMIVREHSDAYLTRRMPLEKHKSMWNFQ